MKIQNFSKWTFKDPISLAQAPRRSSGGYANLIPLSLWLAEPFLFCGGASNAKTHPWAICSRAGSPTKFALTGKWSLFHKWSYPADSEVFPSEKWANLTSFVPSTNFTAKQLHFHVSENFTYYSEFRPAANISRPRRWWASSPTLFGRICEPDSATLRLRSRVALCA